MTELRNVEMRPGALSRARVLVASFCVVLCFAAAGLAAGRTCRSVRHEDLTEQAENNRTAIVPIVPNRGLILDRNGVVLATNYSAYTLEITPSKVRPIWTRPSNELAAVVDITARDRRRFKKLMDESKSFESLPIRTRLTRRRSGALCGAALPVSRCGNQGAPVPQLPLRRTRPAT